MAALKQRLIALREESDAFDIALHEGEADAIEKWGEAIEGMRKRLSEALMEIGEIDANALDNTRKRLSALGKEAKDVDKAMQERVDKFMSSLEVRRNEHKAFEAEQALTLEQRLAELDAALAERQEGHLAHLAGLAERGETLAERLAELSAKIETLGAEGGNASDLLVERIDALAEKIASNRDRLTETDTAIASLTDASVRLLELIQASAEHSRAQLPQALESAVKSLSDFEERTKAASLMLDEAGVKGQALSDYVVSAQDGSKATLGEIEALQQAIAEQSETHEHTLGRLREVLSALSIESDNLSERAQGRLSDSVTNLRAALRDALEELDKGSGEAIERIAASIGERSADAIDEALKTRTAESIAELEKAATQASGTSREAARQLRDQLAKVDELAGNLESRVQRARERAEEQVDNDFARRVALITESLNSNAIDISKALSNDVTDTAWASYLRGDRGIFTRRAVRLLDNSQAREIAEIYDRDGDFREHVSRYIHDFEGMLRTMLSTRDGNALAVTLLSSDMGKLYVALAQAIERLRD